MTLFVTEDDKVASGLRWHRIGDLDQSHPVWSWYGDRFVQLPLRTRPARRNWYRSLASRNPLIWGRVAVAIPDGGVPGRSTLRFPCRVFRSCSIWMADPDGGGYIPVPVLDAMKKGGRLLTFRLHQCNTRRGWPFRPLRPSGRPPVSTDRASASRKLSRPPGPRLGGREARPWLEMRDPPRPGNPLAAALDGVYLDGSRVLVSATGLVLESGLVLDPAKR